MKTLKLRTGHCASIIEAKSPSDSRKELFISLLWPGLYCHVFLYSWTWNYIDSFPLAWTLHLISLLWLLRLKCILPLLLFFVPSLLHPHLRPPCAATTLSSSLLSSPKPQACTRAADKDTNTNWQPPGQARMIETVSVAGGRNSSKRTNTVLLLPT